MFWITKQFIWARTLIGALLGALMTRPAAALLTTPTLRLLAAPATLDSDTDPTTLTEADFTGYTAATISALAGPVNASPSVDAMLVDVTFIAANPITVSNTIYGYYITDAAGTVFYGGELFDSPTGISTPSDFVNITALLPLPLRQSTGQ